MLQMLRKALVSFRLVTRRSLNGARSNVANAISMFTLSRSASFTPLHHRPLTCVQAKPKNKTHADPEKLSHHVHRIGHHFPLEIVQLACSKFGYKYSEEGGLKKTTAADRENWIQQQVESYSTRQALHGRPMAKEGSKDHITGAVREMFPKIPEDDLSAIVNHAFEEVKACIFHLYLTI